MKCSYLESIGFPDFKDSFSRFAYSFNSRSAAYLGPPYAYTEYLFICFVIKWSLFSNIDWISLSRKLNCQSIGSEELILNILRSVKMVWTQCSSVPPPQEQLISDPIIILNFFSFSSSIVSIVGPLSLTRKRRQFYAISKFYKKVCEGLALYGFNLDI